MPSDYQNRTRPAVQAQVKRWLKAGEILAFYVVEDDSSQSLSHTIQLARGLYHVGGMAGEDVGTFRTFAAATAAGFSFSKAMLDHGYES